MIPSVLLLLSTTVLAAAVSGQASFSGDPYTRGEPAAMARLGYVSTGPFLLGEEHGTAEVKELLGDRGMRWVETAHFRIGIDLPAAELPKDSRGRRRYYEECSQLRRLVGAFPAQPKALDAWLRLHLFAQRLEHLYARVETLAGVDDAWFSEHRDCDGQGGPNLGSAQKFVVLLFGTEADLARYLRKWCGTRSDRPWCHRYRGTSNYLFATSAESFAGALADPIVLDAYVVHGVVQNLLNSFCGEEKVPFWWREGMAHWFARQIDERVLTLSDLREDDRDKFTDWDWQPMLRARIERHLAPTIDDLLCWYDGRGRSMTDHAAAWSLVDHLLRKEPAAIARWFQRARLQPMPDRHSNRAAVLAWHDESFRAAFGDAFAKIAAAWQQAVVADKPRK